MTDRFRRWAANRFRELLDEGLHRKSALLQVRDEIKAKDASLPNSRTQIYAWCKRFKVSTR